MPSGSLLDIFEAETAETSKAEALAELLERRRRQRVAGGGLGSGKATPWIIAVRIPPELWTMTLPCSPPMGDNYSLLDCRMISNNKKYRATAKILAIVWAVFSIMDVRLTQAALDRGGVEGNPLARWLLSQSPPFAYGIKVAVTFAVCLGFWLLAVRAKHIVAVIMSEVLVIAFYGVVLLINMMALSPGMVVAILYALLGMVVGRVLNLGMDHLPTGVAYPRSTSTRYQHRHPLAPSKLLRGVAYVWLRGAGLDGSATLRRRVVLVEVGTAVLFAFLWLRYGSGAQLWVFVLYACLLLLLAVIDLERRIIPNRIVYPALLFVIGLTICTPVLSLTSSLLGGGSAMGLLLLTTLAGKGGMGGGDLKMGVLVGLMLGFPLVLVALLFAGVLAVGTLIPLRFKGRAEIIPFGPFLALGCTIALLWSQPFTI